MTYLDTISDLRRKGIWSKISAYKLKRQTKKLVDGWLSDVDFMMSWINSNKDQIREWQADEAHRFEESIGLYRDLNKFIEANCHLILHGCDIKVAVKHMILSQDDWECRFFIRRIYTLFYETGGGFSQVAGIMTPTLKSYFGEESIESYLTAKKQLDKYLERNKNLFKEVRNKCESHKDHDLNMQYNTISQISIAAAWTLIEEGMAHLYILSVEFMKVMNLFSKKITTALNQVSVQF